MEIGKNRQAASTLKLGASSIMAMSRSKSVLIPSQNDYRDYAGELRKILIGQDAAIDVIVPFLDLYHAGLTMPGRPVGIFLLMGLSGSGKTHTPEAIAQVLHGDARYLRVDCGEYTLEHEVAKIQGSPPGYLGHKETTPAITQSKLNTMTSDRSGLSVVLFDEIEKGAPSLHKLLLGINDKGIMRTGDNLTVDFSKTLVFMTSNLGAKDMIRELTAGGIGFRGVQNTTATHMMELGMGAAKKTFSPEFLNRIDKIITYKPLTYEDVTKIFSLEFAKMAEHITTKSNKINGIEVSKAARHEIVTRGMSPEFGAREIKRLLTRYVLHGVARMVNTSTTSPYLRLNYAKEEDFYLSDI